MFASLILEKMCDGKTTLAEAVFETKQENPELTEQVINWETIGNGFVTIDACENVPDGNEEGTNTSGQSGIIVSDDSNLEEPGNNNEQDNSPSYEDNEID